NAVQVQRHAWRGVDQFDVFEFLGVVRIPGERRGVVHDFAHAQELLGGAGRGGISVRVNQPALVVADGQRFAPGGELAVVGTDNEEALVAGRPGGALLEGHDVGRNVDDAVRRNDRAGLERELYTAVE